MVLSRSSSRVAAGLLALGVQPEDRVAIASGTRVEWVLADGAVMLSGGANTTPGCQSTRV